MPTPTTRRPRPYPNSASSALPPAAAPGKSFLEGQAFLPLAFLLLTCPLIVSAALAARPDPKYPVLAIPALLLKEATSVVRLYELTVTLERPSTYTYRVHRVITLLGPGASAEAQEVVRYSKLQKISDLEARVYDFSGKQTRDLRASEWRDLNATDAGTFADDERARLIDLRQPNYPYTVEFAYTITSQNPLFLPRWQPQQDWRESVELATLTVNYAAAMPVRWYEQHLPATIHRDSTAGSIVQHRWTLAHIPAAAEEQYGPDLAATAAAVWLAPTTFEVQGYPGSQASWAELGRWNYTLNAGRDELPADIRAKMLRLREAEPDPYRRARQVYRFLQTSTRYVSIQFGLGGWQTQHASDVARAGYGDCKALTNYCRALMAAAGLPAWCALVYAGEDATDIRPQWIASQFNHVILCLPLKADTVWLECTSQSQPFGFLGSFTANRHALLLSAEGGRLVRTSTFDATHSQRTRHTLLQLDATGNASATVRTKFTGLLYDDYAPVRNRPPDQQRRFVTEQLNLSGTFTVKHLNFTSSLDSTNGVDWPSLTENLHLTLTTAATRSGQRLMFSPNLLAQWSPLSSTSAERHTELWLHQAATYADTVVIQLPAGTQAETLPQPIDIATPFGAYHAHTVQAPDGTLMYVRRLQTRRGHFAPIDFPAYADFRRRVAKADHTQAVMVLP